LWRESSGAFALTTIASPIVNFFNWLPRRRVERAPFLPSVPGPAPRCVALSIPEALIGGRGGKFSRPQPFELSSPHRALFVDAIGALSENIEIVVLSKELDLDALAHFSPRLVDELLSSRIRRPFGVFT